MIPGGPSLAVLHRRTGPPGPDLITYVHSDKHFIVGGSPIRMGSEPFGMWLYRAFGVPWQPNGVSATGSTSETRRGL